MEKKEPIRSIILNENILEENKNSFEDGILIMVIILVLLENDFDKILLICLVFILIDIDINFPIDLKGILKI